METCAKPILNAKNVCDRDEWKRQGDVVPTIIRTMSVCLKQAYVNCQGCTKVSEWLGQAAWAGLSLKSPAFKVLGVT